MKRVLIVTLLLFIFNNTNPRDNIAFLITDMKVSKNKIQILEFGEGQWSKYRGHEHIYGKGQIWGKFLEYLSEFKIPIWYVGKKTSDIKMAPAINKTVLDISWVNDLQELEHSKKFQKIKQSTNNNKGIIIVKKHIKKRYKIRNFIKEHPNFIVVNEYIGNYANNKLKTNQIFQTSPLLAEFKPKWKVFNKKNKIGYMEKSIKEYFKNNTVVLKPVDGVNGWGVIISPTEMIKKNLIEMLLDHKSSLKNNDSSYKYWKRDRNCNFLVEEFAISDPITVNKKKYDATMRIVLAMHYNEDEQKINTQILGGYWKLPQEAIGGSIQRENLNKQHKSKINKHKPGCSAPISEETMQYVEKTLKDVMSAVYATIICSEKNHYKRPSLSSNDNLDR